MRREHREIDLRQVGLVAAREVRVGLAMRTFWVGMVVSSLFIVALALVPRFLGGDDGDLRFAVVGPEASVAQVAGTELAGVRLEAATGPDAAQRALEEGDVDGTVAVDGEGLVVTVARAGDEAAGGAVAAALRAAAVESALVDEAGPAAAPPAPVVRSLDDDSGAAARLVLAYVVSLILFTQIAGLGSSVAQGTMEEKTTRVVDILFSRVRPLTLLVGKVAGVGAFGLLQMAVLALVGIGAVKAFDTPGIQDLITTTALTSTVWFVLGFAFYGFIYAAVAATASRPESLSSALLPLQLLNAAVFVVAVLALQDVTASWVRAMSFVPPFSAILMPLRIAAADVAATEVATAVAVILLGTVVATLVGARVYRRSITGRRRRPPARRRRPDVAPATTTP